MSTVLVVEDQFLAGFELEYALKERGYAVRHVATINDALKAFRALRASGDLGGVVCDNRLLGGKAAATALYHAMRGEDPHFPFVVYSGYPPTDLPTEDQLLAVVHKPFVEQVVSHLVTFVPVRGKGPLPTKAPFQRREAA